LADSRAGTFYTITILLPALALAIAVPFAVPPMAVETPLPRGATEVWLYPRFAIRELATYGLVAGWLLWQLQSRGPSAFARLIWWAPIAMAAAGVLVLLPFILIHGAFREVLADSGGRIVLRFAARLATGYAYVALAELVRTRLLQIEAPGEA
jgi:hypothetical protein